MSFEQIIGTYPLDKLQKYAILDSGELRCIQELKGVYEVIKAAYDAKVARLEQEFQGWTVDQNRTYGQRCAYAHLLYRNHAAVRELQDFEFIYTRERQQALELQSRSKGEARQRFDSAVALLTDHGRIAYSELPEFQRIRYEHQLQVLQCAQSLADASASECIGQIDARRVQRLGELNAEERRAKEVLQASLTEAKALYDAAVAPQLTQKRARLDPIESSFRSSASDFNGRYRSWLRAAAAVH